LTVPGGADIFMFSAALRSTLPACVVLSRNCNAPSGALLGGDLVFDFWPWIVAFEFGRYLLTSAGMAGLTWFVLRRGTGHRIRSLRPSAADYRREFLASLRATMIFSLGGIGILCCIDKGWLAIPVSRADAGGMWGLALTMAAMLIWHDAWFYWTHRAMHWRRRRIALHRLHHLSRVPTPFASLAFDSAEAAIQFAFLPLFMLVVPTHPLVVFLFLLFMGMRAVVGHAGIELHPRCFAPGRAFGWITTTTHHELHHENGQWNFGVHFTWWDRLMGTEHPDYAARFDAATRQSSCRLEGERQT